MPINVNKDMPAEVRRANHSPEASSEAREGATDAPGAMSSEEWARLVQAFMQSDAGKERVKDLTQISPAGWASFVRRFGDTPDAETRALAAATQSMERFLLRTDPASWAQFVGKCDQAKGMMDSAVEQFAKTESSLKRTASTPDQLAKWARLTSASGEDAANVLMALKQNAALMKQRAALMKDPKQSSGEIDVLESGQADLDLEQDVVTMYTQYYQDLTKALADSAPDVKGGGDGSKVTINVDDTVKKLQAVIDRAKAQPPIQLTGAPDKNADPKAYQQWLDDWRRELGDTRNGDKATGLVTVDDDGRVTINTAQTDSMISSLTQISGAGSPGSYNTALTIDTAAYQAWQSARDTQRSNVQANLQTLVTKFQNRQSAFDTLNRVMTSTMSQMADSRKRFVE